MFASQLQESALTMSVTAANSTEFNRFAESTRTDTDMSVLVEIEAVAQPDTLSRLLEPLVVLQVTPKSVECFGGAGGMMRVRIDLAGNREIAERLVRKLDGAVVVSRVEIVSQTSAISQPLAVPPSEDVSPTGALEAVTTDAFEHQMLST